MKRKATRTRKRNAAKIAAVRAERERKKAKAAKEADSLYQEHLAGIDHEVEEMAKQEAARNVKPILTETTIQRWNDRSNIEIRRQLNAQNGIESMLRFEINHIDDTRGELMGKLKESEQIRDGLNAVLNSRRA